MTAVASARILVVDDVRENVRLLDAVLTARGYEVLSAHDGEEALALVGIEQPDLILLDVMMPGLDGYAVCRRLRASDDTAVLPVIMVTSSDGPEKTKAIEAGADDFIPKPFNHDELFARVRSLLRIKRYHDTIRAQKAELAELNATLERRVQEQVDELERLRRLRRFLSPQLADAIASAGSESILTSHLREIAMLFADLRGWTSFVDAVEPEELISFEEADRRIQVLDEDAPLRAVRLGLALREELARLIPVWQKRGYDLDFGAGVALGHATCGEVGFEGRSDYAAIGSVTNLASRLADEAAGGQVLIAQRLYVENEVEVEPAGEFVLKGFRRAVAAFNVVRLIHGDVAP
jgi:adenylate cyclase